MIKKLKINLLIVALALFVGAGSVSAADLTYSVDTIVDLSSPDINLTILAGSVATSTVVGAGSVVVTVPVSSTFTITSADRYLNFSGESHFGVISTSCTSPTLSKVIITTSSTAQTITITPGPTACVSGGGGGGYNPPPATPATPATPAVPAVPTVTPAVPATPATPAVSARTYNFGTITLRNGNRGESVKELQRFLNAKLNLGLVVDGKLGPKTIAIIKKWQKANGLKADGLVGAKTKAKMNAQAN